MEEEIPKRSLEFQTNELEKKPEEDKLKESKQDTASAGTAETGTKGGAEAQPPSAEPSAGAGGEKPKEHITGTNVIAELNALGLDVFVFDRYGAVHTDDEDKNSLNDAWNALFEKYGVKADIVTNPIGRVVVANLRAVAKRKDAIMEGVKKSTQEAGKQGVETGTTDIKY